MSTNNRNVCASLEIRSEIKVLIKEAISERGKGGLRLVPPSVLLVMASNPRGALVCRCILQGYMHMYTCTGVHPPGAAAICTWFSLSSQETPIFLQRHWSYWNKGPRCFTCLVNYTCSNPESKQGHMLTYQGSGLPHIFFLGGQTGDTIPPIIYNMHCVFAGMLSCSVSPVWLCDSWIVAHQTPLPMGLCGLEYSSM